MSELDRPIQPETDFWVPIMNIRPHHFEEQDGNVTGYIKAALMGRIENPEEFAKLQHMIWISARYFSGSEPSGYEEDVLGNTGEEGMKWEQSLSSFVNELTILSSDSVVSLGPDLDRLCRGCAIGNHCTAVNYRETDKSRGDMQTEAEALGKIYLNLLGVGRREGFDFVFRKTNHILYDYHGQPLDSAEGITVKRVHFRSMLVKVEALRDVAS